MTPFIRSGSSAAPMRVLVFGAGAVGTYIGGSLALNGQPVVFLERPETKELIAKTGVHLALHGTRFSVPNLLLAGSLSEALDMGQYEVAIFALKSFDTHQALQEIAPFQEMIPPILCLQNGVENEAAIAGVLGTDKVIAGTLTSAIGRPAPGEILLERLRGVGIADDHPLSIDLAKVFNAAGLNARLYPSAPAMKWSKLVTNLMANASSAILGMTPAEIYGHPGLYRLETSQLQEALNVMEALKIPVVDLPGTPVPKLAFSLRRLPLWLAHPLLRRAIGSGRGGKMPSFHIDLHSGRGQSEVDFLNGAVARFGERLDVPTPANRLLTDILLRLTKGEIPLEEFNHQPEKLLALWQTT